MGLSTRSLRSRTKRKDAIVDIANKKTPRTQSSSRQCELDPKRKKNSNDSGTEVASKDKVRLLSVDTILYNFFFWLLASDIVDTKRLQITIAYTILYCIDTIYKKLTLLYVFLFNS